jgi:hypothetical protein
MIVASKYFDGWSVDCDGGYYTRNCDGVEHHGCKNKHTGYHYFKQKLMHRCIWAEQHGRWPLEGMHIGHLDETRDNNVQSNLKEMTPSENNKAAARHRSINMSRDRPCPVIAKCLRTGQEKKYRSQGAAAKDLKINQGLVSAICNKVMYSKSAKSKQDGSWWTFTKDK